jgi:hypothetical protein
VRTAPSGCTAVALPQSDGSSDLEAALSEFGADSDRSIGGGRLLKRVTP